MNIRHLSVRLLQVYGEVVRGGSVTAAANRLHLTQPTVSIQLKKLTELVGEPLLEPSSTGLKPTEIGQMLYQAAQDVLGRFDDFNQQLEHYRAGLHGHLTIAVVSTAQYLLPKLLTGFKQQFSGVDVTVSIGNRAQILQRFQHQLDDIYMFSHPPSGEQVQAVRLLKNPLQLIAPPGHWASGRRVRFADLIQETFLIREPGSATRLMFESWLSNQGVQLPHVMQMESNEMIRLSVSSGLGLAVLSAHTLQENPSQLCVLDVEDFPLQSHWHLVRRADQRLSYAAQSWIRYLAEHLADAGKTEWVHHDAAALLPNLLKEH
ncbi:MAG TPA: LysR family transcriptional regulator [Rheinheimera sp.]|nr:LysR family transcriptional regulator [Rheinheimera sp.]